MGEVTEISWTHHTFNPWTGCVRISEACRFCYAETFSDRFNQPSLWGPDAKRKMASEKYWNDPIRWNKKAEAAGERRRVFCASMSDIFEDRRDLDEPRKRVAGLIERTPWLDWLLLTKRPEHVNELADRAGMFHNGGFLSNVWMGTTTENQEMLDERAPELINIKARIRFLSCEPLLGPIKIPQMALANLPVSMGLSLDGNTIHRARDIHWVIVGGESGDHARPMHPEWARSIIQQCRRAEVPVHFKQNGQWMLRERGVGQFNTAATHNRDRLVDMDGNVHWSKEAAGPEAVPMSKVGKKAAGCLIDATVGLEPGLGMMGLKPGLAEYKEFPK